MTSHSFQSVYKNCIRVLLIGGQKMTKKEITIITFTKDTLNTFAKQFEELGLADDFHLVILTTAQLPYKKINKDSLIILSSKSIKSLVMPYIPKGSKLIIAKRTLNHVNIRKLLEIAADTEVLVVSDRLETSLETIELLRDFSIGLKFTPYYPGALYPDNIDIAVTPGEVEYVPKYIRKVINIGSRVIDLSTWIDVYAHFNFDYDAINKLTARYVETLIFMTRELNREIHKTNLLKSYLESIIDSIDESLVVLDHEEKIRFINERALDKFHLKGVTCLGQKASELLPKKFYKKVTKITDNEDHMIDSDNKTIFVRKTKVALGSSFSGQLILFREAEKIEKMEHDYRLKVLSKGHVAKWRFENMSTVSTNFRSVIDIAKKLAPSSSTILLLGETGTGKELLAQSIHNASKRKNYPFVGVNFAAISESLLESELFGYEEGAFTGARKGGHSGFFEQAHKGTIFLDEIGDASLSIQSRLLRVLQEKQIMRVGGNRVIPIDIRVIAATNKELLKMVEEEKFRADLYYRLNVLPIEVPPLRERKADIPLLAKRFINNSCKMLKRPAFMFSDNALEKLLNYDWPGNIRELENLIEYLAHIVDDIVYPHHFSFKNTTYLSKEAEPNQEYEDLYFSYLNKGFLVDIQEILEILSQRDMGRRRVLKLMKQRNINITEQQLRYRMELMTKDELINPGKGRQGSSITKKGSEFMQYLQVRK